MYCWIVLRFCGFDRRVWTVCRWLLLSGRFSQLAGWRWHSSKQNLSSRDVLQHIQLRAHHLSDRYLLQRGWHVDSHTLHSWVLLQLLWHRLDFWNLPAQHVQFGGSFFMLCMHRRLFVAARFHRVFLLLGRYVWRYVLRLLLSCSCDSALTHQFLMQSFPLYVFFSQCAVQLSLIAPQTISSCDSLTLDATASTGSFLVCVHSLGIGISYSFSIICIRYSFSLHRQHGQQLLPELDLIELPVEHDRVAG